MWQRASRRLQGKSLIENDLRSKRRIDIDKRACVYEYRVNSRVVSNPEAIQKRSSRRSKESQTGEHRNFLQPDFWPGIIRLARDTPAMVRKGNWVSHFPQRDSSEVRHFHLMFGYWGQSGLDATFRNSRSDGHSSERIFTCELLRICSWSARTMRYSRFCARVFRSKQIASKLPVSGRPI
jgi:hypothetical protein